MLFQVRGNLVGRVWPRGHGHAWLTALLRHRCSPVTRQRGAALDLSEHPVDGREARVEALLYRGGRVAEARPHAHLPEGVVVEEHAITSDK